MCVFINLPELKKNKFIYFMFYLFELSRCLYYLQYLFMTFNLQVQITDFLAAWK